MFLFINEAQKAEDMQALEENFINNITSMLDNIVKLLSKVTNITSNVRTFIEKEYSSALKTYDRTMSIAKRFTEQMKTRYSKFFQTQREILDATTTLEEASGNQLTAVVTKTSKVIGSDIKHTFSSYLKSIFSELKAANIAEASAYALGSLIIVAAIQGVVLALSVMLGFGAGSILGTLFALVLSGIIAGVIIRPIVEIRFSTIATQNGVGREFTFMLNLLDLLFTVCRLPVYAATTLVTKIPLILTRVYSSYCVQKNISKTGEAQETAVLKSSILLYFLSGLIG